MGRVSTPAVRMNPTGTKQMSAFPLEHHSTCTIGSTCTSYSYDYYVRVHSNIAIQHDHSPISWVLQGIGSHLYYVNFYNTVTFNFKFEVYNQTREQN